MMFYCAEMDKQRVEFGTVVPPAPLVIPPPNVRPAPHIGGGDSHQVTVPHMAQSSFKLQQFLCSRGYAMDNLDEAQRIHPS